MWMVMQMAGLFLLLCCEGKKLNVPCKDVACWYCKTPRISKDCADDCRNRCKHIIPPSRVKSANKPAGKLDPNEKLLQCCEDNNSIPGSCHNLCNYDKFTKQELVNAYVYKTCPGTATRPLLVCAASGDVNHRKCCLDFLARNGPGLEKCADFCYPANSLPEIADKYLECLDYLPGIQYCFKSYAEQN